MDIHKLLPEGLKIESPFTWELDIKQVSSFHEEEAVLADYEECPVTHFLEMNTFAYIRSMKGNIDAAEELIREINDVWNDIYERVSEQKDCSVNVLMHIKDTTAYCIYLIAGKKDQSEEMEIKIKNANDFKSDIEKGTIVGSQAIALSLFKEKSIDISLKLAKQAISYVPNCALWHYVTAKCLRRKRRYQEHCLIVSEEEENEFLKCYELSQTDQYSLCVARMYKESKKWQKCSEIYNEIYSKEPTNMKVRLILALYFMNKKDFFKAKNCLNYVEKIMPPEKTSKTYYHYLGKYYEKTKDFAKAKENYLKAIGHTGNFPADMDHFNLIRCSSKNNYDGIKYLQNMLKRYEDNKSRSLNILVHLGIIYLIDNKNLKLAADYFLKAIKINPCDPQLTDYRLFYHKRNYNIFQLISRNILTGDENNYGNTLKELKNYCIEYKKRVEKNNVVDSLDEKFAKALSLKE
ncbi:hypothetical protein TKK_0014925 [Trichogramma kaykai]|uniref:Tetratricopeptide repeat protein n=1 Tax=Trichogramma kaykai TaxID=54128 RepID=A0ABD2WD71_9HYME